MRMYDVIAKKRDGFELSEEEIAYVIQGYVNGEIPDYQMASFLMAVYFRGMTEKETFALTNAIYSMDAAYQKFFNNSAY